MLSLILNLHLSILLRMIWNIWLLWIMLCFVFICIIIKINHSYLFNISFSHTLKAFVSYGYVLILLNVCNLLSSLLLSAILLISSVYTQCASISNFCCDFCMISFLNKQFWESSYHHLLSSNMFFVSYYLSS